MFHQHDWKETERISAPRALSTAVECSERLFERLTWGVTTIVLTCARCGDKKTVEVLGTAPDTHGLVLKVLGAL